YLWLFAHDPRRVHGLHQRQRARARLRHWPGRHAARVLERGRLIRCLLRHYRGEAALAIHEEIIVLRNREIYRLDLHSTPERYAKDLQQLNALLRSWRWEAIR